MNIEPMDEQTSDPSHLRLLDALARWGDQSLVEALNATQAHLSTSFLAQAGIPRLAWRDERSVPAPLGGKSAMPKQLPHAAHLLVDELWLALKRSFRAAIETGVLHLEGVEADAAMDREPQAIRGAFAAEMQFDFELNTVRVRRRKFLSVTVSRTPSPWAPLEVAASDRRRSVGKFNVADLTTDQIVELIEEHARRVVAEPGAKLMAPEKVTLIPLVRMKLHDRAARGDLLDQLGVEAIWLATWIGGKVEHYKPPKSATIEKTLRREYNQLKRRSNAAT